MAKKQLKEFPKTVYVQHYDDGEGCEYLVAEDNLRDASEADLGKPYPGVRIGVYVLKELVRITATHTYGTAPLKSRACR